MVPTAEETDELQDHDEGAGGGFGEAKAIEHLRSGEPTEIFDCLLGNVGQNGIGTTEGNHRGLTEEDGFLEDGVVASQE